MSELAFNRVILEKNNQTLAFLSLASLALNVILAISMAFSIQKPPLVVFEDTEGMSALRLKQYKVQEEGIKTFTTMIVSQYLNFNAATLPKQVEAITPYLGTKPLDAIMDSYKRNQDKMEKERITQEFIISDTKLTRKKSPFWVEVECIRVISSDDNKKSDPITYIFEVQKVTPTTTNPYGLKITNLVEKKAEEKKK